MAVSSTTTFFPGGCLGEARAGAPKQAVHSRHFSPRARSDHRACIVLHHTVIIVIDLAYSLAVITDPENPAFDLEKLLKSYEKA